MTELLASLLIAAAGLAAGADLGAPAEAPAPRILCQRPASLALRRFEDRSAQVMCSGRVLARIAVPG